MMKLDKDSGVGLGKGFFLSTTGSIGAHRAFAKFEF